MKKIIVFAAAFFLLAATAGMAFAGDSTPVPSAAKVSHSMKKKKSGKLHAKKRHAKKHAAKKHGKKKMGKKVEKKSKESKSATPGKM